ncbi:MAG: Gfo/Idh/MocA family oxidoreductase [Candidatus Latescibacterota bacterium]
MDAVRLGYVGCGYMAQKVHLPNFAGLPGCRVVALAEVRRQLGARVQQRFGIERLYGHHLEMAGDPQIDAFAVSAAFAVQGEIARDLLRTGRPVFVEKPMAVSVAQARGVLEAARTPGARLMVAYMKRYDAGNELVHRTVADLRASGDLGAITYVRGHDFGGEWVCGLDTPLDESDEPVLQETRPATRPDWLPEEQLGPYVSYLQRYVHNVNLVRYFLDAGERVRVRAVDLNADARTGIVVLEVDGVRTVLETGRLRHHRWDEHTQIYFQDGWVHTWAPPLLLRNQPAEVEIYRGGVTHAYTRPIPGDGWSWSYRREAEHFIHGVRSGEAFRCSGEDALVDVRVFEEIYRMHLGRCG